MIASNPSPGAYEALGLLVCHAAPILLRYFGFRIRNSSDPDSWQSHYDLGVALLSNGNPKRAAHELQTASVSSPATAKFFCLWEHH